MEWDVGGQVVGRRRWQTSGLTVVLLMVGRVERLRVKRSRPVEMIVRLRMRIDLQVEQVTEDGVCVDTKVDFR